MMKPTKAAFSISIDADLLAKLDKYAESLGEARSTVIQRFIREGLKKTKKGYWLDREQ